MKICIYDALTRYNGASGYGQMSANIGVRLQQKGHDVYYVGRASVGTYDPIIAKIEEKSFKHTDDTIYLWIRPPHYIKYKEFDPEKNNVFFTMHEQKEFKGWKADWPKILNKCKAVITPTKWNKNIFQIHGVKVPIHVIPLGVNTNIYRPNDRKYFSILTVHEALGSNGSREDWTMTLEAFYELFGIDQRVRITIKTWNFKDVQFWNWFNARYSNKHVSMLNIVTTELTNHDMAMLYRNHDLFIKNSIAEGWSLPLTEAKACNLPILISDNPVLVENVGNTLTVFRNKGRLKDMINEKFRAWRELQADIDKYSWSITVKKLEEALS